jgi:Outer membrane efflux protein
VPLQPNSRGANSYKSHLWFNRIEPIRRLEGSNQPATPERGASDRLANKGQDSGRPPGPEEQNAMKRVDACIIGALTILHAVGVFALAQDVRIPVTGVPSIPPPVRRITLEDAEQLALANNTGLALGRLGVQEKSIAADAARRDYLPKLLGNFYYFHFNDNLGKVATFRTGTLGILPPGTRTIEAAVTNQDSTLAAITLAQPITKLIAVNAAVQLARADTVVAQAQLDKGTKDLLSGVAQAFHGMYGAQRIETALNLQVQVAGRLAQTNSNPEIRVAMIEAQQALLQVRSQITELTEQLNSLLGLPSSTRFELVDDLPPAVPVNDAEEAV